MNYKLACTLAFTALFSVGAANAKPGAAPPKGLDKIGHIIVIYLENHSFDNLYGLFPGADGIAQAKPGNTLQVDANGKAYTHLPRSLSGFPSVNRIK